MKTGALLAGMFAALIAASAAATDLEVRTIQDREPLWSLVDDLVAIAQEEVLGSAKLSLQGDCINPEELAGRFPEVRYLPVRGERVVEYEPLFRRADNKPHPKFTGRVGIPARYLFVQGQPSEGHVTVSFFPSDEGPTCIAAISVVKWPASPVPISAMESPVELPAYPWRHSD